MISVGFNLFNIGTKRTPLSTSKDQRVKSSSGLDYVHGLKEGTEMNISRQRAYFSDYSKSTTRAEENSTDGVIFYGETFPWISQQTLRLRQTLQAGRKWLSNIIRMESDYLY